MRKINLFLLILFGIIVPVFFACPPTGTASASTTGFAWSTNAGWLNFGCASCDIQVTTSAVTGYAWSQNYGWISLSCSNNGGSCSPSWGVTNSNGTLGGNAWGQNTGWVDFSGASINASGQFTGQATGSNVIGQINFSCTDTGCPATTTWTPSNNGGGGGGGGSHYECSAQKCILVSGSGTSTCANDDACKIACSTDTDCGTNGFDAPFCKDGNVYEYPYTCNNAGETTSSCVESTTATLEVTCSDSQMCYNGTCATKATCSADTDCGNNGYDSPFCQGGNVYQSSYACIKPGTPDSSCLELEAKLETNCTVEQTCSDGACVDMPIGCSVNTDCGNNGYKDSPFCKDGNVYQNYYTCSNPYGKMGEPGSICVESPTPQLQQTCSGGQVCNSGSCVNQNNKHNECENSKCVVVNSNGIDQCSSDDNCKIAKHNECNVQNQCVSIDGAGADQCQTSGDCGGGGGGGGGTKNPVNPINPVNQINPITEPIKAVEAITNAVVEQIPEPVKAVTVQTQKIINTPQGSAVTKTVSTTGLVVATAATVATTASVFSFSFLEIFLIPIRLFALLLTALGIKKRIVPWGVVYDSVTKRPLDPAYVILKNNQTGVESTAITDLDGRYGFLVDPGVYQITARKTNYIFPSQKLAGKDRDELHQNLYFGGNIEIKAAGDVIIKNIPLDSVKFDWNEFAKKDKKLMKFYSKWDIALRKIYDYFFIVGFIIAGVAFIFAPYPYNTIIVLLYVILLLLRIFGLKPRTYGYIEDKTTGAPLSFAIIRVMLPVSDKEIASKSADKYGKYYCLVPPGKYYFKIEKKNDDGSYSLVYTSDVMDVSHKGIIKEKFKV